MDNGKKTELAQIVSMDTRNVRLKFKTNWQNTTKTFTRIEKWSFGSVSTSGIS